MRTEQVSALSDTELNRAMIWLYPPEHRKYDPFEDDGEDCWSGDYVDLIYYDYLGDYNLTMPLVVENNLSIESPISYEGGWWAHSEDLSSRGKTLLRAICETLVLLKVNC